MDRLEVMAAFESCPAGSLFSILPGVALGKQQCECSGAAASFNTRNTLVYMLTCIQT